ncbi:MAG: TetR/AcrR family transcriptional regulator [Bacteroidales bacterium]
MREQVIVNSIDLFCRDGIKATSMDRIAQDLRLSKRTLYEYFGTKENLVQLCVEHQIDSRRLFSINSNNLLDYLLHCYEITCIVAEMNNHQHLHDISKIYFDTFDYIKQKIAHFAKQCGDSVCKTIIMGGIREDIYSEFIEELIGEYLINILFPSELSTHNNRLCDRRLMLHVIVRGVTTQQGELYIDNQLTKAGL